MKSPRGQPLDLSDRHRSQKRVQSIIIETASRDPRWDLIIVAIHLVFVSIRGRFTATQLQLSRRPGSTWRRPCGGPAIMIMHPVNGRMGAPGMGGMGGGPGITGTEYAPLSIGLWGDRDSVDQQDAQHREAKPNRQAHDYGNGIAAKRLRRRHSRFRSFRRESHCLFRAGDSSYELASRSPQT
jgi:hypothetical protein